MKPLSLVLEISEMSSKLCLYFEIEVKIVVAVTTRAVSWGPWSFTISLGGWVDGMDSDEKCCPERKSMT